MPDPDPTHVLEELIKRMNAQSDALLEEAEEAEEETEEEEKSLKAVEQELHEVEGDD
jgi:hypothetical protein